MCVFFFFFFKQKTAYEMRISDWSSDVCSSDLIPELIEGIAAIGELGNCDAVLSGYLGSAAQGRAILTGVARIKACNPKAIYLCDPVMGHPEKGCIEIGRASRRDRVCQSV